MQMDHLREQLRLLHGAGEQALHEVALEGEEHHERHEQRQERGRRDDVEVGAELAHLGADRDGQRLRVAARTPARRAGRSRPTGTGRSPATRSRAGRAAGPRGGTSSSSDAPSIRAASSRSRGMPMKKFRSRKIANGSPNAMWNSTSPRIVSNMPSVVVEREDRDQRHLDRHDQQRDDDEEHPVAPGELEPGERVRRERRDRDREDRAAERDPECVQNADVITSLSKIAR